MCPGMRPATGWIAYFTSTPFVLEQLGEVADVVLRLRDREPVAGDEDDAPRVREHDRDVVGRRRAHRLRRPHPPPPLPAVASTFPNAPKRTFAIERFIARAISIVSSVPDAPTSIPLTIRTFECRTNPVAAAASPVNAFRSEITTGMSAPPIGSTNTTPNSAATRIAAARSQKLTDAIAAAPSAIEPRKSSRVPDLLARIRDRPPADQVLQLPERDERARERDRADERREDGRDAALDADVAGERPDRVELDERDERRRAAADAVEQRHHLRHRGHLHLARADDSDHGADRHPGRHPPVAGHDLLERERDDDRPQHPGRADLHARAARAAETRGSAARG